MSRNRNPVRPGGRRTSDPGFKGLLEAPVESASRGQEPIDVVLPMVFTLRRLVDRDKAAFA